METGQGDHMVSSRGEIYSYVFAIPNNPASHRTVFEYENYTQQGQFQMHSLAWVDFGNSTGGDSIDLVTFSGFGVWTKNGVEQVTQVAAQFFNSPDVTYVGIQIGPGGEISNVNLVTPTAAFPVPGITSIADSCESPDVGNKLIREGQPTAQSIRKGEIIGVAKY